MRFSLTSVLTSLSVLSLSTLTSAVRVIESNSLNPCMSNSSFTASLFRVAVTPDNSSISIDVNGVSSITGNVTAQVEVIAYGFTILNETIDPCTSDDLAGFCDMQKGQITIESNSVIPASTLRQVPGIAYAVPDLDGIVRLQVYSEATGDLVACLEAELSNTKSVYQKAVGWATAIIAGLGLIAAGITSGLGHPNTAAHVAANAVSLFGVFQAQAIIGMTSVSMPPIVQSWTQNFQWSMGIIRVGFLQSIATWYQRATGGTPTTYLSTLSTISVQVEKRAIKRAVHVMARAVTQALAPRGLMTMMKRATSTTTSDTTVVVRGIDRVGFRAGIEQTNIFMTGLIFFLFILVIVSLLVALAKVVLEGAVKAGWMKSDKFLEFRNGWRIVIKGILFRLVLLGFVQMSVLCLWELVERDSAAEIVLALCVFISMAACLVWASFKVIMLAKRSVTMHKNPAYILYSDPTCLNKWGFLYVSYKATSYYFVTVLLVYIVLKAVFIAFAQSSPVAQAIGLVIIEALMLIIVSVLRPWMDKKTNAFNIAISVINFLNSIFLLIFSDAFGQPAMVSGVMGVIFALYNVIFILVLLIMVLIASVYAVLSKNPETRYQPMRDDRGSFIKSQSALTTELDALGATARGDPKDVYMTPKEMDESSLSSDSLNKAPTEARPMSQVQSRGREATAMYPSDRTNSRGPGSNGPTYRPQSNGGSPYGNFSRPGTAPSPYSAPQAGPRQQPPRSAHGGYPPQQFRGQESGRSSPWQRGAGYE